MTRKFSLATGVKKLLSLEQQQLLVNHYHDAYPDVHIVTRTALYPSAHSKFIHGQAQFHNYLILDGRRIIPSSSVTHAPNSIIQADYGDTRYVTQVIDIITHHQPGIERDATLLNVRWFSRNENIDTSAWDP